MQQHYEMLYIVSIKFLEDELQQVIDGVANNIKELTGEINSTNILGKQRLAYPIKFTHQGTYVCVEFDMESRNVLALDKQMLLNHAILRHLTVKKHLKTADEVKREKDLQERLRKDREQELAKIDEDKKTLIKKDEAEKTSIKAEINNESIKEKAKKDAKEAKKSTLEDIDKKIDEILTETIL